MDIEEIIKAVANGQPVTIKKSDLPPDTLKAVMELAKPTMLDKAKNMFTGELNRVPGYGEYDTSDVQSQLIKARQKAGIPVAMPPTGEGQGSTDYAAASELPTTYPPNATPEQKALIDQHRALNSYSFARHPEAKLALMKKFDPETAATVTEDPWGNPYVIKNGQKLYLNKPGVSTEDFRELGDQMQSTIPFALAPEAAGSKAGAGLMSKILQGALVQGAGSVATDLTSKAGGSGQGINLADTAANTLAGGAGEALVPIIGKIGSSLFSIVKGPKYFTPGGNMKPAGAALLKQAGLDWDSLSGDVQQRIKLLADKSTDPQNLVQLLSTQDLPGGPIRLTRAQATGNIAHYADEDLLRSGALGDSAANKMKNFDQAQAEDIRNNVNAIGQKINPTRADAMKTWGQGGAGATTELQNQKQTFANVLDDSYDAARDAGKAAYYPSIDNIKAKVANDPAISPIMNPQLKADDKFMAAWKDYQQTFGGTGGKPSTQDPSVSVNAAFAYLQRLNASIKNNPGNASLRALKQQLQRGLADDALANTVKGDPAAVAAFLKSNKMYRDFANTYKADDIVQTLTEQSFDPMNPGIKKFTVDPADGSKIILGASRLGFINKTGMRQALNTLKTQLPQEQWNNLREEVFLRSLGWTEKDFASGNLTKTAADFKTAMQQMKTQSPEIYNTLFSPDERAILERFGDQYAKATLAPPTKSTMGSRTTPLAMRALQNSVGAISPKLKLLWDFAANPIKGQAGITKALGPSLGGGMTLPPEIQPSPMLGPMMSLPGSKGSQGLLERYQNDVTAP